MKKLLAIILAAILCLGLMAGCGQTTIIVQDGDSGNDATPTPEVTEPAAEETPAESEAPVADDTPCPRTAETGLALVSVVSDSSKAATAEADGMPRPTPPSCPCSWTATASFRTASSTASRPR